MILHYAALSNVNEYLAAQLELPTVSCVQFFIIACLSRHEHIPYRPNLTVIMHSSYNLPKRNPG